MQNKKVLLLGSYGQTNLGDDLLLWNYLEWLNSKKHIAEITINTANKELMPEIIKKYPNLIMKETYTTSVIKWLKIIKNSDAILYGGGTIYKELYKSTGRGKYSVITRIFIFNLVAKLLQKKVYNLHIGIGSIKTRTGKFLTKGGLKFSSYTIFRDTESYLFAKDELSIDNKKICLANDGIFLSNAWLKTKSRIKPKSLRRVGINLVSDIPDWVDRQRYIENSANLINKIIKKGYKVVFLPFQYDYNPANDKNFIESSILPRVKDTKSVEVIERLTPSNVSGTLDSVDYFIGMRFHSMLIALMKEVPFVGIEYDIKCSRLMKQINYPSRISLKDWRKNEALQLIESLVSNHEQSVKDVKAAKSILIKSNNDTCLEAVKL